MSLRNISSIKCTRTESKIKIDYYTLTHTLILDKPINDFCSIYKEIDKGYIKYIVYEYSYCHGVPIICIRIFCYSYTIEAISIPKKHKTNLTFIMEEEINLYGEEEILDIMPRFYQMSERTVVKRLLTLMI
jgi:hypothetical protein